MGDAFQPVEWAQRGDNRRGWYELWIRRLGLAILLAIVVVALCNVVGQRASSASGRSPIASLTVHSPTRVRSGLLFQAKFTIVAHQSIPNAALVLGSGWFDGLTLNTSEPSASTETSGPAGSVKFVLGTLNAGETYTSYFEYQVNPTSFSSRTQTAAVESNGAPVVSVQRTMTIVP